MKTEEYEFNIASHFACLIEYGNEGGYTDEDEEQVDTFLNRLNDIKESEGASNYAISYGEDNNFSRCEICHLHADCVTATVTYFFN